jgi:hypothetical protein
MITLNTESKICLSFGGNTYCFDDEDDYRKLVLAITDPSDAMPLVDSDLVIDSKMDDDYLATCERYAATLQAYLLKRKELLTPPITSEDFSTEQSE